MEHDAGLELPLYRFLIAPQFSPPGTLIEGSSGQKVVGTGVYTFWNDMLYLEVSAYQNLSTQTLRALGEAGINESLDRRCRALLARRFRI